ncbi:MAG TPA: UbiA family prenyltransferase [Candidatus Limnocylindrales bacterium]
MEREGVAGGFRPLPRAAGSAAARLARFALERFPPAAYGPLIAALALCGTASAALDRGEPLRVGWDQVWVAIAAGLAFLQLRALDELRDEAADRLARPERPLPRGLVSRAELRALAATAAIAGVLLAAILGPAALACYGLAIGQVWLLDFLDERRPSALRGMVGTALLHSGIVPAVLLMGWATIAVPAASAPLAAALLLVWGAGLVLEIGRKTVTAGEERPGIATYSAALGRPRALALLALFVMVTGAAAAVLALVSGTSVLIVALPLAGALAASAGLVGMGDRIATRSIKAGVPLAVLAALLAPVLLADGLR